MLPKFPHPTPAELNENLHCASRSYGEGGSWGAGFGAIVKKIRGGCLTYLRWGAGLALFVFALALWFVAEVREWRMMRALGLNYEGPREDF